MATAQPAGPRRVAGFFLAVHGGAGWHDPTKEAAFLAALRRSCAEGARALQEARAAQKTITSTRRLGPSPPNAHRPLTHASLHASLRRRGRSRRPSALRALQRRCWRTRAFLTLDWGRTSPRRAALINLSRPLSFARFFFPARHCWFDKRNGEHHKMSSPLLFLEWGAGRRSRVRRGGDGRGRLQWRCGCGAGGPQPYPPRAAAAGGLTGGRALFRAPRPADPPFAHVNSHAHAHAHAHTVSAAASASAVRRNCFRRFRLRRAVFRPC